MTIEILKIIALLCQFSVSAHVGNASSYEDQRECQRQMVRCYELNPKISGDSNRLAQCVKDKEI